MPHKKKLTTTTLTVPIQLIERKIYLIRGQKVMVDSDLAELYGVSTSRLNEQVTRNLKRFPQDFMFRLTKDESESLRSHFAISKGRILRPKRTGISFEIAFCDLKHGTAPHPKIGTPAIQIQQDSNQQISKLSKQ